MIGIYLIWGLSITTPYFYGISYTNLKKEDFVWLSNFRRE